jgi:transcriptional regulator NrdR family protein
VQEPKVRSRSEAEGKIKGRRLVCDKCSKLLSFYGYFESTVVPPGVVRMDKRLIPITKSQVTDGSN